MIVRTASSARRPLRQNNVQPRLSWIAKEYGLLKGLACSAPFQVFRCFERKNCRVQVCGHRGIQQNHKTQEKSHVWNYITTRSRMRWKGVGAEGWRGLSPCRPKGYLRTSKRVQWAMSLQAPPISPGRSG